MSVCKNANVAQDIVQKLAPIGKIPRKCQSEPT